MNTKTSTRGAVHNTKALDFQMRPTPSCDANIYRGGREPIWTDEPVTCKKCLAHE